MYRVEVSSDAEKQIKKLPKQDAERIVRRILSLRDNPRPHGVEKLKDRNNLYRVRQGDFRIIYSIRDKELYVLVVKIGNRREVYK